MTASLAVAWLLALPQAIAPAEPPAPPPPMPAGRPPEGFLVRSNPKCYEVRWELTLHVTPTVRGEASPLRLEDATLFFPLVPLSTWSRVEMPSVQALVQRANQPDASASAALRLDRTVPGGLALAVVPLGAVTGQSLRVTLIFTGVAWRSDLDDAGAARVPWPAEWPPEAAEWLKPQWMIESDDPRFREFVDRVAGARLRFTSVFVAAKELIRATCGAFRGVEGSGLETGRDNRVRGLRMVGAAASMESGSGTEADLVCACVAVLRAAGIPSRAVIGVSETTAGTSRAVRTSYIVWGEFYLPGSGWVPFDPARLRGAVAGNTPADRPWPGLGRIRDLNNRMPLSYFFLPPRQDASMIEFPGAWGWSARGLIGNGVAYDTVRLQMTGRPLPPDVQ